MVSTKRTPKPRVTVLFLSFLKKFPIGYVSYCIWDVGRTEVKNSTDVKLDACRFQEHLVQDELIAHSVQEKDSQLRSRQHAIKDFKFTIKDFKSTIRRCSEYLNTLNPPTSGKLT